MEKSYTPGGVLGRVGRIYNLVIQIIVTIGALASAVFLGAMFLNVILRYVFSSPIFWFDEMIVALLIWYSALGTVVCYWTNEHAVINFFLKFFNRSGKIFLMFMPHLIVAVTSCVFIVGGQQLFGLQINQLPQGGLPFSRAYYYALPMVVMGIMLTLCAVYRTIEYIATPKDVFLERFQKLQDEGGMIIE